jgi:ABC-type transport system involved in cytochrome bd biosynthesis fused ATPase/permease subunit
LLNKNISSEDTNLSVVLISDIGSAYEISRVSNKNHLVKPFFTFKIFKNKFNILEGESGVGKTTLAQSIAKEMFTTQPSSSNSVTFMPQDSELFAGTMSENIFIGGNPSKINHEEFTALLKALRLTDLYYRDGEGTYWINEENNNLSGGERRRICLARHLISKPNILILDFFQYSHSLSPLVERRNLKT